MPRVIVMTETSQPRHDADVLLDESVRSVHLSTGHAAAQLVERLAWAISDAEDAERARRPLPRRAPERASRRPRRAARERATLPA